MGNIFISKIVIDKVRHLKNLEIELSSEEKKYLILTGKNGSGKTSLLNSIATFLNSITSSNQLASAIEGIKKCEKDLKRFRVIPNKMSNETTRSFEDLIATYKKMVETLSGGVTLSLNCSLSDARQEFIQGHFVVAYYKADRVFKAKEPEHVEKVQLKDGYGINETPRNDFIKYLLDLKMTQALADSNGKKEKADSIRLWFDKFQDLLKRLFKDDSVKLDFDEDTFKFKILMNNREPFDFNTLSSGYAAVLDIIVDLILRMTSHTNKVFDFSVPGIVLIDEIETHLHLELQKEILDFLTTVFPNVQFIVSTHSPFILNSLDNSTIYDLEKHLQVKDGLTNIPYSGIVEGYFDSDTLSKELKDKFERYKALVEKENLTDDDIEEISSLEVYLDEIPDYLALNITTEYQRLKMKLRKRESVNG